MKEVFNIDCMTFFRTPENPCVCNNANCMPQICSFIGGEVQKEGK